MTIVIYSFSGLHKKTHIQNVYNVTERKLKHSLIVIINIISAKNITFVSSDDIHA